MNDKTKSKKIGIIGSGVMGEAFTAGLLKSGFCAAGDLTVSDESAARLEHMRKKHGVKATGDNNEVAESSEILLLAVKPDAISELLKEIAPNIREHMIVISIAAGVKLASLTWYAKAKVVRAMPNICTQAGEGMTALSHTPNLSEDDLAMVQKFFESTGKTIWVDESKMDAVTAISGSGPAYIYLVMEAMTQGGVEAGLPLAQAKELVRQTFRGASALLELGGTPAELREKITSPNGTTAAALHRLESHGVRGAFLDAISAAVQRSRDLG